MGKTWVLYIDLLKPQQAQKKPQRHFRELDCAAEAYGKLGAQGLAPRVTTYLFVSLNPFNVALSPWSLLT